MAKAKNPPHRVAPSAWTETIRQHFFSATEFAVQVRPGTRGSWRELGDPLARVEVVGDASGERDVPASSYAQTLYDRAWSARDELGIRLDAKLVVLARGKDGIQVIAEETRGGRLHDDDSEDVPDGETVSIAAVWNAATKERDTLVRSVGDLSRLNVETLKESAALIREAAVLVREGGAVRVAEAAAVASAHRADAAAEVAREFLTQWRPAIERYAEARYQESTRHVRRPATGDAVLDAWRALAECVDLSTARELDERFGDRWHALRESLAAPDSLSRFEVLALWSACRDTMGEGWRDLLASLPAIVRERFVALAAAVAAAEAEA